LTRPRPNREVYVWIFGRDFEVIRIAVVHPDPIAAERLRLGKPRFNAEWIELFNASGISVDVDGYFVVNGSGGGFTIELSRPNALILGPYQSLVIFSGFPDEPADPATCYLANQATRLFLKRDSYFWDPEGDGAYLFTSRAAFAENPEGYVDSYHYKRRSPKIIIAGAPD
jgi:hypothetical protein